MIFRREQQTGWEKGTSAGTTEREQEITEESDKANGCTMKARRNSTFEIKPLNLIENGSRLRLIAKTCSGRLLLIPAVSTSLWLHFCRQCASAWASIGLRAGRNGEQQVSYLLSVYLCEEISISKLLALLSPFAFLCLLRSLLSFVASHFSFS